MPRGTEATDGVGGQGAGRWAIDDYAAATYLQAQSPLAPQ